MVNLVEAQKPILRRLVRMAGLRPISVTIEPGTVMHFWAPKHCVRKITKPGTKEDGKAARRVRQKPAVILIHGFAAEGIITWQFNFGVLVNDYDLYIPDLLFFGKSITTAADRSPDFQAACVARGMDALGVAQCDAVGFSYGGMVAFKLAEARPDLVRSLVVSGSVITMTDVVNDATMSRLGVRSSTELLMPENVKNLKSLLSISMHKKLWLPDKLYKDYLEAMYDNRKERIQLLEGLVVSGMEAKIPSLQQRILLLWGENDKIFEIELARKMKQQLGEKATLETITKGGHLLHLERPCAYNRHLRRFLKDVNASK